MEIAVDRYLNDGRTLFVTLALRSRTTEMHSALTALDQGQRDAVHAAIVKAANEIAAVVQPVAEETARRG